MNGSGVYIEVLGGVRARLGGRELALGPPLRQAVLAVLALRANRTVSRDEIVDAVWGDEPPASAVNAVHVHVAELRRMLEPGRGRRAAARVLAGAGFWREALAVLDEIGHYEADRIRTKLDDPPTG